MRKNCIRSCAIAQDPATAVKNGICVLQGFGLSVSVDGQHLLCRDGIADERHELRLSRATCGLKRLVIIGHSGSLTLDALRWLYKLDIGITVIDTDGNVLLSSIPAGADYPHLRRAQALAKDTELGTSITREILHAKISGQAKTVQLIAPDEGERIVQYLPLLNTAHDAASLRLIEAQAAASYWKCWEGVAISFTRQDGKRVPEHWLRFGTRSSPISSSSRKAATPGNAVLNYLYAILEMETTLACQTVGLDPGMGFLHHDQPSRDNLALDLMETVRPHVDAWVLAFLQKQTFRKHDFHEDENDGCVRIAYEIRELLMDTAPRWAKLIAPWAERVAQILSSQQLPTRLTQAKRSQGREGIRKKAVPSGVRNSVVYKPVCHTCGDELLSTNGRKYCQRCSPDAKIERIAAFATSGTTALNETRKIGNDPAHGGEAASKRGRTQVARIQQRRQWDMTEENVGLERERFITEVQPKLKTFSLTTIVKATGLSLRYASLIRKGERIPHPVHFQSLRLLVQEASSE